MQIDWFTLVAQMLNFLILLWLLKRFAYKPILHAMDERKKRVALAMREAHGREEEAVQREKEYRAKKQEIEDTRQEKLREAQNEADEKRKVLTDQAREEVEAKKAQWRDALEKEKDAFVKQLRRDAAGQVYEALRDAIRDLADSDLEDRIVAVFIERIRNLPEGQRHEVAEAAGDSSGAVVQTAFDLTEDQRNAVRQALAEAFDIDGAAFERESDLVAGIEMRAKGRKVAWSVQEYLESVGAGLFAELEG